MINRIFGLLLSCGISAGAIAAGGDVHLDKAPIDPSDSVSIQRGAQIYMNNCQGCHSLEYMRYDALAVGAEIVDEEGKTLDDVVKENLLFVGTKMSDPIISAMDAEASAGWFGAPPPDLSLVARSRGVDWLYTYMRTFYVDPSKPWGVNNLTFPDVGMPHVLLGMQGEQRLVGNKLEITKSGTMSAEEYNAAVADLVNFLSFVGEPVQVKRQRLGVWVLVFLGILFVFSYLLKREYWKDVH